MKPKVSILVPCYNVEKYLRQCMNSIVNQTLKDIEIICINDGSTDDSLNILQEYAQKDDRVIIINKANSGYGDSMNQGLEKATGEYIGIVESDDFAELDMFEKLYNAAIKQNAEVVKSNFWGYLTEGNVNTLVQVIPTEDENEIICPLERQKIFWSMPCIWCAIYKKDFLQKHGIKFLPTPGASYQDTGFNFKVWAMAKRAYFMKDAFLHYRQDNENSSVKSAGKVFCVCDEYHEIEKFAKDKKVYEELKFLLPRLKFATYLWNFRRLAYPLNWQFLKVFSEEFLFYFKEQLMDKKLFGKKLYKNARKIAFWPRLFFAKYYFRRAKKCLHL